METENTSSQQKENVVEQQIRNPYYPGNKDRDKSVLKMGLIALIGIVLLIPTFLISDLITERWQRKQEVSKEIEKSWGAEQQLGGMVFQIPYWQKQGKEMVTSYLYLKPDNMAVKASILPFPKHISIFEVMTYKANADISCKFENIEQSIISKIEAEKIQWQNASIIVGISDIKGLSKETGIKVNGLQYALSTDFSDDAYFTQGLALKYPLTEVARKAPFTAHINFEFRGTQQLSIEPTGKYTDVYISGKTEQVSFLGDFLSHNNKVQNHNFEANWKILPHNRAYKGLVYAKPQGPNEVIKVKILDGIDGYDKTERSIKYAILVIGLTLLAFFFMELLYKKRIHPLQYALVGIALCIYYTLLLSLSEYIEFNMAYLISSLSTITLIVAYAKAILKDKKLAIAIAAILTAIYVNIFMLISMEDYALICGSIGLFIIVSILMYFSKRLSISE